ncbi:zingipain-2-like [Varroa destructor]|uniref:Uncharacterized protein n=1 Tax=Varroa destructor TaxID=109461 RepID=A0A7M7JZD6_VARDE|nr:zingipain-2-like [Varroa destructor]
MKRTGKGIRKKGVSQKFPKPAVNQRSETNTYNADSIGTNSFQKWNVPKMRPSSTCVFALLLSRALANPTVLAKWENFKVQHAKQHPPHEEPERMEAFLKKDAEIEAHNVRYAAGQESYSRQHSQYSDLTHEEFRKYALGFVPAVNASEIPHVDLEMMPGLPESFDWREQGILTPVKNQRYCGSCYAFSAASLLESYIKWKNQMDLDLSEQDIIDCSYKTYAGGRFNNGCRGGWPSAVLQYYNSKDIVLENTYPYTSGKNGRHGSCMLYEPINNVVKGKLHVRHIRVRDENRIREILVSKGPLIIALAADNKWKRFFDDLGDGVYDNDESVNARPNHAVLLVGYGTQQGKDYWIIKNSWGDKWGVNGYGKIRRGRNMCGINTFGVFFVD